MDAGKIVLSKLPVRLLAVFFSYSRVLVVGGCVIYEYTVYYLKYAQPMTFGESFGSQKDVIVTFNFHITLIMPFWGRLNFCLLIKASL